MQVQEIIEAVREILVNTIEEKSVYSLTQAWLVILRHAYTSEKKQFSEDQLQFLKRVRVLGPRLKRFIELQEDLKDPMNLEDYSQAMQELKTMSTEFEGFAVARRVKKEIRELIERRDEILEHEKLRKNAKLTEIILQLEESAAPCPKSKHHRLEIRQSNGDYFWGCNAYPACRYTRPLNKIELQRLDTSLN